MAKIAAQNLPGRGTAMRQSRLALLAGSLLIGLCADAAAQMITQPPMQMPGQPPMQVPGQPPQGAPPCMTAFLPLRSEAERRAETLKSAVAHKVTPDKLCPLFKSFSEAEGKVVKYATANQAQCGIPPDAVAQMKTNHGKTLQIRDRVCAAGDAPKPSGPNLGEALGTRILPTPETTTTGGGTLDTLTGNALAPR